MVPFDKQTVEGANAVMGRTVIVPGAGPNPTHYHENNDVIGVPNTDASGNVWLSGLHDRFVAA